METYNKENNFEEDPYWDRCKNCSGKDLGKCWKCKWRKGKYKI